MEEIKLPPLLKPNDSIESLLNLPKALAVGDEKVAALLKPIATTLEIGDEDDFHDAGFAHEIFAEPYSINGIGDVHEWEQITHWLKTKNTNPDNPHEILKSKELTSSKPIQRSVQKLLDKYPQLRDSNELYLPRHWVKKVEEACAKGDIAAIKRLCDRDKRLLRWTFNFDKAEGLVEDEDYDRWQGKTLFHLACRNGKLEAITQLVTLAEQRAPGLALLVLLKPDTEGLLPLHHAILGKQNAKTLLTLAAWMRDHLHKVNLPSGWKVPDTTALDEALRYCVRTQDLKGIDFFLRLGANPNATDSQGESLVYLAAKAGLTSSLKRFLNAKANPNARDPRLDDTLLHAAVRNGHDNVVQLLKKHGANLSVTINDGSTPLHLAAAIAPNMLKIFCGEDKTLPLALREASDGQGHTPLQRAVLASSLEGVKWLRAQKASLTHTNKEGQTVLHLLTFADHPATILPMLLTPEIEINAQDLAGNTPLHLAATMGDQVLIAALLEAGSAPHLKNKAGYTARECAEMQKKHEAVACMDRVIAELQAKKEALLKAQGPLGEMILQLQKELEAQRKEFTVKLAQQQSEIVALRQEVAELQPSKKEEALLKGSLSSPAVSKFSYASSSAGFFDEKGQPGKPDAQLQLQDQLVSACEIGNEMGVMHLLNLGAKPDFANTVGKQPLGAAVWGMKPEVVKVLLKEMEEASPMTWEECEKHNLKYYGETFVVSKFAPKTYVEWRDFLKKMEAAQSFTQAKHVGMGGQYSSAASLIQEVRLKAAKESATPKMELVANFRGSQPLESALNILEANMVYATEKEFADYRNQITQAIMSAATKRAVKKAF